MSGAPIRILHLAYEDPRQPGAGGGSVRTLEINRRLARRHQVTALVSGYRGARKRVEDGVRWVPVGTNSGTRADRLSYFAALGAAVQAHPHDLIVEDFGAPFSVGLAPLYSRRPLVASVQWLFAREMRAKYHLPFDRVERAGLGLYHRFIAVSDWLGRDLRERRPGSVVDVIPNGVPPAAFGTPLRAGEHFLFLGRLDLQQKGGDLLLESYRQLLDLLGPRTPPLLIAGDGPDRAQMERQAAQLGLDAQTRFVGRAEGERKFDLIGRAHAVLMPSRFETFGLVAVEAQAAGAPLVCFDAGPLREVAGEGGALLIPPFRTDLFARAAASLVQDPAARGALQERGRHWARRYDWDRLAELQEASYYRALAERPRGGRR